MGCFAETKMSVLANQPTLHRGGGSAAVADVVGDRGQVILLSGKLFMKIILPPLSVFLTIICYILYFASFL